MLANFTQALKHFSLFLYVFLINDEAGFKDMIHDGHGLFFILAGHLHELLQSAGLFPLQIGDDHFSAKVFHATKSTIL